MSPWGYYGADGADGADGAYYGADGVSPWAYYGADGVSPWGIPVVYRPQIPSPGIITPQDTSLLSVIICVKIILTTKHSMGPTAFAFIAFFIGTLKVHSVSL